MAPLPHNLHKIIWRQLLNHICSNIRHTFVLKLLESDQVRVFVKWTNSNILVSDSIHIFEKTSKEIKSRLNGVYKDYAMHLRFPRTFFHPKTWIESYYSFSISQKHEVSNLQTTSKKIYMSNILTGVCVTVVICPKIQVFIIQASYDFLNDS